jgi:dienelactone hydrolase
VLRSTDAKGVAWRSSAVYTSDGDGRLDLARDAPAAGSYSGAWGSGLLVAMRPADPSVPAYLWSKHPLTFVLKASVAGKTAAVTRFRRWFGPEGPPRHTSLAKDGFVGDYLPSTAPGKHLAVLAFGGSNGGDGPTFLAALLAAHGYPSLSLAYFRKPGLPQSLSRIPLEYFARALRWLARQPGVDPHRILVLGISRGSEAALLLGVHYPKLVHGVIAAVPSNVANAAFPNPDQPAWTLGGKSIPYTLQFNNPAPTDVPAAVIPVERIRGPIFLVCGGLDAVWGSCPYSEAIVRRLDAHHSPHRHELFRARLGGHLVGAVVPYEPGFVAFDPTEETTVANEQARERLWPRLLAFLAAA